MGGDFGAKNRCILKLITLSLIIEVQKTVRQRGANDMKFFLEIIGYMILAVVGLLVLAFIIPRIL